MHDESASIRVLHVEDDEAFAEVVELKLETAGPFEVVTETDPRDALDHLETDIDCVVSDYDMPHMDGLELLEAVRDESDDVPFILFTGKGSEAIASRAISAGVTDYLQKGAGSDTYALLANRIENAVAGYRTAKELDAQERLSERIVRAAPVAIVVHNRDGDVMLANERATAVLGTDASDLDAAAYPDSDWELTDADGDHVPLGALPYSRIVAGETIHDERYTVRTGDGCVRDIVVHGAPLRDDNGDVDGAVVSFMTADE